MHLNTTAVVATIILFAPLSEACMRYRAEWYSATNLFFARIYETYLNKDVCVITNSPGPDASGAYVSKHIMTPSI
jgi:hypothetical protein